MSQYTDLDALGGSSNITFGCDLSGTATCQTVVGLQGRTLSNNAPTDGQFLVWNAGASVWEPTSAGAFTAGGDLSGTSTNQTVIGIQTVDVANTSPTNLQVLQYNSSNVRWEPTTLTFSGDLSGNYASITVAKINGATVPAAGALTTGNVLQVSGVSALSYGPVNLAGGSNYVTGTLPVGNLPSLAGDVTGTISANTVEKINGTSVPSGHGTNEVLVSTSPSTAVWSQIYDGYIAASAGISYSKLNLTDSIVNADINSAAAIAYSKLNLANSIVNGDVSASAAIAVSKLAAGTAGQLLLNNSTPTPTWTTVSGDISISSAGATLLEAIRGKATDTDLASIGATQDGYVLTWVNGSSEWQAKPTATTVTSLPLTGDVGGTTDNNTVNKINGTTITTAGGALSVGSVLRVTGVATADWGQLDLADTDAVTGILPTGNQAAQTMAGDVSGTTAASVVDKLKTKSLASALSTIGATQDGYVLTWVNGSSEWQAQPLPPSGIQTIGTIDSQTKSADGLVIVGTEIYAQTADASFPGLVSTGTQTFAGNKTLSGITTLSALGTGIIHANSSGVLSSSLIVNNDVDAAAAIAYSKLNLSGSIVNADINGSAAIAYSKLNLSSSIVNADIASGAAIAVTKLAAGTAGQLLLNNATPEPTWTTMSGDTTISSAGATTLVAIRGKATDADLATVGAGQDQYVLTWDNAAAEWQAKASAGGAPTGSAGGDLSGTYPNPTVAKINGTSVDASPNADEVLTATSATVSDWKKIVNANVDTAAAIAVSKLAAGTSAQVLLNNSTPTPTWTTFSQDATVSSAGAITVAGLRTKSLASALSSIGSTQDGYQLTWVNASSEWQALPNMGDLKVSPSVTVNYAIASTDQVVRVGTLTSSITLTLPSSPNTGKVLRIKNGNNMQFVRNAAGSITSVGYTVTVTPASGNIDGLSSFVMNQPYMSLTLCYNGSEWMII